MSNLLVLNASFISKDICCLTSVPLLEEQKISPLEMPHATAKSTMIFSQCFIFGRMANKNLFLIIHFCTPRLY